MKKIFYSNNHLNALRIISYLKERRYHLQQIVDKKANDLEKLKK